MTKWAACLPATEKAAHGNGLLSHAANLQVHLSSGWQSNQRTKPNLASTAASRPDQGTACAGGSGGTASILSCPARETRDVSQSDLRSCRSGTCLATLSLDSSCSSSPAAGADDQYCRCTGAGCCKGRVKILRGHRPLLLRNFQSKHLPQNCSYARHSAFG